MPHTYCSMKHLSQPKSILTGDCFLLAKVTCIFLTFWFTWAYIDSQDIALRTRCCSCVNDPVQDRTPDRTWVSVLAPPPGDLASLGNHPGPELIDLGRRRTTESLIAQIAEDKNKLRLTSRPTCIQSLYVVAKSIAASSLTLV